MFGEWIKNIDSMKMTKDPFDHIIIDNFLEPEYAEELYNSFPTNYDNWYNYNNPLEVKYAYDKLKSLDQCIQDYFKNIALDESISIFSKISGIHNLEADPTLHGAGLHCHTSGGKLNLHLDYEKHPRLVDKQRRLNVILFMTKEWKEEWNGANELWDENVTECKVKTYPKFNRAIIFKTNDISWHGLTETIKCPEGIFRKSIAYYYLSPLETDNTNTKKYGASENGYRMKASYIKRPQDPYDEKMEQLFKIRSIRRITNEEFV